MSVSSPSNILITGATGFVGGAVALEYLASTEATLHCLVRAESQDLAEARIADALHVAARAYGREALLPLIAKRVRAVRGDLAADYHDMKGVLKTVDLVLHAAASLKYADRDAPEIRHINVTGTANIVRLAEAVNAERLCYVSTAYVAGAVTGQIAEVTVSNETVTNNEYERSKIDAESIVASASIPHQIVRPSVVIGHSTTHAATSFSGVYGMLDELVRFKTKVAAKLGHLLSIRGIAILAEPDAELNLIPIDYAARAIAQVSTAVDDEVVFHIVNGRPPTAGDCLKVGFALVELPEPRFVSLPTQLSDLDRKLQTEFYDSYLRNGKSFATANTLAVCGAGSLDFPINHENLETLLRWYLDSGNRRGGRLLQPGRPAAPSVRTSRR